MTVESILAAELVEFVGRFNVVMQVDGIWYQVPFDSLLQDDLIRQEMDRIYLDTCFFRQDSEVIEDLRVVFINSYTYFARFLHRYIIQGSRIKQK